MRGTECISFDFLYTDRNYIYINIIKYLKTKNILLKEMLFAQNKKHCIPIIHSFFKKLFIQWFNIVIFFSISLEASYHLRINIISPL